MHTQQEIVVSVQNLGKSYPPQNHLFQFLSSDRKNADTIALDDVSLDIHRGEHYGLVGRNGSGKTTLLKIMASLLHPTRGSVSVAGYDSVRDERAVRSCIGYVPADERSFFWRLTCRENLLFFGRLYGLNSKTVLERSLNLARILDIEEYLPKRFDTLSSGKKQLISIIRGMLREPVLLIVDEPTRSLDIVTSVQVRRVLLDLASHHKTTLLIATHDLKDIDMLCTSAALLKKGKIVEKHSHHSGDRISERIEASFIKELTGGDDLIC